MQGYYGAIKYTTFESSPVVASLDNLSGWIDGCMQESGLGRHRPLVRAGVRRIYAVTTGDRPGRNGAMEYRQARQNGKQ